MVSLLCKKQASKRQLKLKSLFSSTFCSLKIVNSKQHFSLGDKNYFFPKKKQNKKTHKNPNLRPCCAGNILFLYLALGRNRKRIFLLSGDRWHLGTFDYSCKHIPLFPILLPQLKFPSHPGLAAQKQVWQFFTFLCSYRRKWMTFSFYPLLQTCPFYLPIFFAAFLLCQYPSQICSLLWDGNISACDKGWEKVLKSDWKSWMPMFEKHCFIFPVIYKEIAQVEAVVVPV